MRIIILSALYFLFFGRLAFAESYLCIQDQTVGFNYHKKQKAWLPAYSKDTSGIKYIIKKHGDKPDNFNINYPLTISSPLQLEILKQKMSWPHWSVTIFGADFPWAVCLDDFSENGDLDCDKTIGFGGAQPSPNVIHFNRNTLRFLMSQAEGYYDQGNNYKPPELTEWTDEERKKHDVEIKKLPEKVRKVFEELDRGNKEAAEKKRESDPEPSESSPLIAIGTCSRI